jgi:hypothetical protein
MLYVILVNICFVDQLISTVQREFSKLQMNPVSFFIFCKKHQKRYVLAKTHSFERFTSGFVAVNGQQKT